MKKYLFFAIVLLVTSITAQNKPLKRICGSETPSAEWNEWFNKKVDEFKKADLQGKNQSTNYTIPVIFHVIHGGQSVGSYPNISQTQINSQITILNDDYAGVGLNAGNISSTGFSPGLIANCNVKFCLAEKNPSGAALSEKGIERINYTTNSWASPTSFTTFANFKSYIDATIKPNTIWDPTRYLNIWITDVNSAVGLLGYATFPSGTSLTGLTSGLGTATTDGVWCWSKSIGDVGTLSPPYDKGRTATHEIGHWLGLRHIWGDANCGDDYCTDTPTQQQSNAGCPTYPSVTCSNGPNGDLFMNFMDYTDDLCMYMFTNDQRTRIQAAMASCPYRSQLTASSSTLCTAASVCSYTVSNFTVADTLANPFGVRRATASPSDAGCAQGPGKAGYIAGTNCFGDKEKAEFFNASKYSSATYPMITGAVVLFYQYNTNGTDGTGNVDLNIYSATSAASAPGTLLGSKTENLATIVATTNTTGVSFCGNPNLAFGAQVIMPFKFTFASPITAPTTGGFYASVSIPSTAGDTVAIFDKLTGSSNTAWEKWSDNSWHDMKSSWGGSRNFNLAILPIIECGSVGVKENSIFYNNVNLFPNPSNGNFSIVTTLSNPQAIDVTVYNLLGQSIYSNKVNNVSQNVIDVNLTNQSSGVYLVEINNGKEKIVKRMVLTK